MPKYLTKQRKILLDYLSSRTDESISAGELAQALSDRISKSAVYRNLADMEAEGRLRRVAGGGSREAVYQYIDEAACRSALHLSCKKCGKTVHMKKQIADELVATVAESDDFSIDKGDTVIYGICSSCRKAQ